MINDRIELIENKRQFYLFEEHLKIENNSRIIFSGKFGIGKTTFLNEFFDSKSSVYNVIKLFPINYSISSNEDILDLLKYDIINELINNFPIQTEEYDFSESSVLTAYINSDYDNFFNTVLRLIPKIGKEVSSSYKSIAELIKRYYEFKEEFNSGELSKLQDLVKIIEDKKGGYYQNDFYINFISKKLEEIKGDGSEKKQNVLIIDDLDRIDPEHIFRLFNVFAAHLHGNIDVVNKFGFDKIVFSCDIQNIEAIYHHKYGKNADFTGYIDKFYSNSIYYLDNRSAIRYWIEKKLPIDNRTLKFGEIEFITDALNNMLDCNVVNFRNIKSISSETINLGLTEVDIRNRQGGNLNGTVFIWIAPILSAILGSPEFLINKLNICKEIFDKKGNNKFSANDCAGPYILSFLLPVALYSQHRLNRANNQLFNLSSFNQQNNSFFEYKLKKDGFISTEIINSNSYNTPLLITNIDVISNKFIWDFFIKAVEETWEQCYIY